ncbi:hypothetical protein [Atlantibacter hermannii]|uniref:hypothetical protein n=1 Tax=Atlantibacter hermannii TaxID=565 RepID=UPI0028965FD8|nr:hypothetical protein [Atlantibacter hermannii]
MSGFSRIFRRHELFRRISGLSPVAIELYGYLIEKCDWRLGRHVASTSQLALELNVSERSIQRANKELEAVSLLKVKRGIYAINPEFSWGGRSWNIPKAAYHSINAKTAQVISFAEASQALSEESAERAGRETLREISARKRKGNQTC